MTALDEILRSLPIDQLAQQMGASPQEVEQAATAALPALLGGLHANASDPAGRARSSTPSDSTAVACSTGASTSARWTPPTAPRSPRTSSVTARTR